ncbi:MAG: DUF4403 family protein [Saprospiraceae bacterium]|nr:DUF4403 family protein [Saprospiraceae bacterium]
MTNAPKPLEQYATEEETPLISTLTIPINIPLDELVRSLNNSLSKQALYEDYSFDDNGADGLMLNAWKSRDMTLSMYGNTLKYRVPLKIWIKKALLLGASAEAEAELALNFKTVFSLNQDWTINTQTEVEWHEWLKNPVLKTGIGDISVETIANMALNRSKKTLAQALDQYVAQQINLRPYVQAAWTAIQAPILLDSAYQMWTKTTPTSIGMTPITTYGNSIRAKIAVECINDVTFGQKPSFRRDSYLPNLNLITEAPDDFMMQFATDVPFAEAERLAKNMMVGQVFESGKKKVKVEDIMLWGNNDKVVVNTRLSGSFNGNIYFIGKPEFNAKRNLVEVKDLDYHLDTKSFLLRSASWLFQGPIKKKMASAMSFPLEENVNYIKTSAQSSLSNYVIQPGVILNGTIDSVSVQDVHVTPKGIRVDLFSKGKVNVDVKGL